MYNGYPRLPPGPPPDRDRIRRKPHRAFTPQTSDTDSRGFGSFNSAYDEDINSPKQYETDNSDIYSTYEYDEYMETPSFARSSQYYPRERITRRNSEYEGSERPSQRSREGPEKISQRLRERERPSPVPRKKSRKTTPKQPAAWSDFGQFNSSFDDLVVQLHKFVSGTMSWVTSILFICLPIIQFPLALLLICWVLYWGMTSLLFPQLAIGVPNVCNLPIIKTLELCKTGIELPEPPKMDSMVKEGLDYTAPIKELQNLGGVSVGLPRQLRLGEFGVRELISQITASDPRTKEKIMPLFGDYSIKVDRTIDGLQDLLGGIDQIVVNTININKWAEDALMAIEAREASAFRSVGRLATRIFLSRPYDTESQVREMFSSLTDKVSEQVDVRLGDVQEQRGNLVQILSLLDSIATAALGDHGVLEQEKMGEASYWRWVLRSHREKMAEFDKKIEKLARFYDHTHKALKVVQETQIRVDNVKGGLRAFRQGLANTPLTLDNGRHVPLRLYIDALKSGVQNLEEARETTKRISAEDRKAWDAKAAEARNFRVVVE